MLNKKIDFIHPFRNNSNNNNYNYRLNLIRVVHTGNVLAGSVSAHTQFRKGQGYTACG